MTNNQQPTPSAVVPVLVATLVCDVAVKDPSTGKANLIGIFDRLWSGSYPTHRPMTIYFKVADAEGYYDIAVRFVRLSTGETLAEGRGPASISDRLLSADAFLAFPPLPFPAPGRYEFQIFANDVFIGAAVVDADLR